tara:strand:- start:4164 stop:5093 length:930 start_codon:yes stop_codon:yes gene_type:complete
MRNALEIINLNKTYRNGFEALKNINLEIKSGDFFAFLGPNGAGKSTVIGIISSLVTISSGSVRVLGEDIMDNPDLAKKNIGIVPQEYNLNQFIPIQETMLNVGGYFGITREEAQERTYELFNQLGIWEKKDLTPRELSGGMKRRLMIARALIHKPNILILDEPTAGVDTELRLTMWDFFQDINKKGVTIILTTHYLEEAERLCKNLAIIHKGEIIQNSSMADIYNMKKNKTYLVKSSDKITSDIKLDSFNVNKIDEYTIEITCENKFNISDIVNELNKNSVSVLNIINKRNQLEELFMELTNAGVSNDS